MLVIAHRGGARLAPENTLAAFRNAVALGADGFELDVHLSRDGHLVVIHDETLERTTSGSGAVAQHTLEELQRHDAGGWFGAEFLGERLPSLAEALAHDTRLVIELKHAGAHDHLLRSLPQGHPHIVICFDPEVLLALHAAAPELETGYLCADPIDLRDARDRLGVRWIGPHYPLATAELIAEAHALGLKVNPWTVNERADMERLIREGADAITTDAPDLLLEVLGR